VHLDIVPLLTGRYRSTNPCEQNRAEIAGIGVGRQPSDRERESDTDLLENRRAAAQVDQP
jgi:hypothetical protein